MNLIKWKEQVKALLLELNCIDFGYPLGSNIILDPNKNNAIAKRVEEVLGPKVVVSLISFYKICNGLSWPDVQNGYFIKQSEDLGELKGEFEISKVLGDLSYDVVVLGSSGNGTNFALDANERVLLIPAGKVENFTYFDSDGMVLVLANSLVDFLLLLLRDLRAFVDDDPNHQYIV